MLEVAHEYGGHLLDLVKNYGKLLKNGFDGLEEKSWSTYSLVVQYIRIKKIFLTIGFMGIKRRIILHRFQHYQVT
jgi:hypothetical protein